MLYLVFGAVDFVLLCWRIIMNLNEHLKKCQSVHEDFMRLIDEMDTINNNFIKGIRSISHEQKQKEASRPRRRNEGS